MDVRSSSGGLVSDESIRELWSIHRTTGFTTFYCFALIITDVVFIYVGITAIFEGRKKLAIM